MAKKDIKIQTRITDFDGATRAFVEVEKIINSILALTTQAAEGASTLGNEGETGEIRVVNNPDKTYSFNIKTKDGWKTPVWKGAEITFNDKPKKELTINKSITEIEADDTSTGNKDAEKTIFEESTQKFNVKHLTENQTGGLMKPDYVSNWIRVTFAGLTYDSSTNTPLTFTHNLGVIPKIVQFHIAPDIYNSSLGSGAHESVVSSTNIDAYINLNTGHIGSSSAGQMKYGTTHLIRTNDVLLKCGNASMLNIPTNMIGAGTIDWNQVDDAAIRVLIWK